MKRSKSARSSDAISFPEQAEYWFKRALSFIDTPRECWKGVKRLYHWALRAGLKHFGAHYNLARLSWKLGDFEEAEKHYRKAIELKPDFYNAYNNLGIVLGELGRYEESEWAFREALRLHRYASPHCNLAELYSRQGRLHEAESEIRIALQLAPGNPINVSTYAEVLEKMQRFDEAEKYYRRALALSPGSGDIHQALGELLVQMGRQREAEEHFARARELSPAARKGADPLEQWAERSRAFRRRKALRREKR